MSRPELYAELSYGDETVTLPGTPSGSATYIEEGGIEGWWSTPDAKWSLTERSYRDGAYSLGSTDEIVYASRVITVNLVAVDEERDAVLDRVMQVLRAAGKECTLRVVDASTDLCCTGYATVETEPDYSRRCAYMTLTLECPDPCKYATEGTDGYQSVWVYGESGSLGTGGLYYNAGNEGLVYVISYGEDASESASVAAMTNHGSMTAYPTVYLYNLEDPGDGHELTVSMTCDGATTKVSYTGYTGGEPVVLDYRDRRASRAGTDTSKYLNERSFRGVPSGSSATFRLTSTAADGTADEGLGKALIILQDTYI